MTVTGSKRPTDISAITREEAIVGARRARRQTSRPPRRDRGAPARPRRDHGGVRRQRPDAHQPGVAVGRSRARHRGRSSRSSPRSPRATRRRDGCSACIASHFWLVCLFPAEAQEEMWGERPQRDDVVVVRGDRGHVRAGRRRVPRLGSLAVLERVEPLLDWAMLGIVLPPAAPDEMPTLVWGLAAARGLRRRRRLADRRDAGHRVEHAGRRRRVHPRPPVHQPVGGQRGDRAGHRDQPVAALPPPVRARARVLPLGARARCGRAHVRRLERSTSPGSARRSPAPRSASRRRR